MVVNEQACIGHMYLHVFVYARAGCWLGGAVCGCVSGCGVFA